MYNEDSPMAASSPLADPLMHSGMTDDMAIAVAVERAAADAEARRRAAFSERPRLLQLVAGIAIAACCGGLRAGQLASIPLAYHDPPYGFSDEDASWVRSVSLTLTYFALPAGMLLDSRGPRVVLAIGGLLGGLGWLAIALIAGTHIPPSVASVTVASALISLAVPFLDIGSLLPNLSRFSFDKGTVLIAQQSYETLGAFIFSAWYRGFFNSSLRAFAYFTAAVVFLVSVFVSRLLTMVPLPEHEHEHPWHGHRRFALPYVIVFVTSVLHFVLDIGADERGWKGYSDHLYLILAIVTSVLLCCHGLNPLLPRREFLDPIEHGNFSYANAPAMPPARRFRRVRRGSTTVLRVHIDAPGSPDEAKHVTAEKKKRTGKPQATLEEGRRDLVVTGQRGPRDHSHVQAPDYVAPSPSSGVVSAEHFAVEDAEGAATSSALARRLMQKHQRQRAPTPPTSGRSRVLPGATRPRLALHTADVGDDPSLPRMREATAEPTDFDSRRGGRPRSTSPSPEAQRPTDYQTPVPSDDDENSDSVDSAEQELQAAAAREWRASQGRPRAPSAMYSGDRSSVVRRPSLSPSVETRESTRSSAFGTLHGEDHSSFQIQSSLRYSIRDTDLWLIGFIACIAWGTEAVFDANGARIMEAVNEGVATSEQRDLLKSLALIARFVGLVAAGAVDGRTVQKTLMLLFAGLPGILACGAVLVIASPVTVHVAVAAACFGSAWARACIVLVMKQLFCATHVGAHFGFVCIIGMLGPALINLVFFQTVYNAEAQAHHGAPGAGISATVCTSSSCILPPVAVCGIASFFCVFAAIWLHTRTLRLHRVYVE